MNKTTREKTTERYAFLTECGVHVSLVSRAVHKWSLGVAQRKTRVTDGLPRQRAPFVFCTPLPSLQETLQPRLSIRTLQFPPRVDPSLPTAHRTRAQGQ